MPRCSSGFRLIWMRPLLSVVLVPSAPMNEEMLSTAGSARITFASSCCILVIGFKRSRGGRLRDSLDDAGILGGKKPLGMVM